MDKNVDNLLNGSYDNGDDGVADNRADIGCYDIKCESTDAHTVNGFGDAEEEEEEGEIKEEYELRDADDMANLLGHTPSMNGYIDDLIRKGHQATGGNIFDDLLPDIGCLDDLIAGDDDAVSAIRDRFEMRHAPHTMDDDDDSEEEEEMSECEIPPIGSILNTLLRHEDGGHSRPVNAKSPSSTPRRAPAASTTRNGRIGDKNAELEYLLPVDLEARLSGIVISSVDQLQLVGTVIQRVDGTQTVTMQATRSDPILDLETVVFDGQKRKIGVIDNIFGTKREPLYLVICKDVATWQSFEGGEQIFVAPDVRNAYFTAAEADLRQLPQDDADSDIAFSDDEKEEAYRRQQAGGDGAAAVGEASAKRNKNKKRKRKPQQSQQQNGPPQPRNPFRTVNTNPFAGRHSAGAAPMWAGGAPMNNPFMNPFGQQQYQYGQQFGQQQQFPSFPPPHMGLPMPMMHMPPPPLTPNGAGHCSSYTEFQKRFPPSTGGGHPSRR